MNDAEFGQWMKGIDSTGERPALPDAGAIWWRAQLRQRIEAEERATRPIRIAERLACTVCLMAAVVLAVLTWGKL